MTCTIDYRCLDEGFGGKTYKRKREEAQSQNEAFFFFTNFIDFEILQLQTKYCSKESVDIAKQENMKMNVNLNVNENGDSSTSNQDKVGELKTQRREVIHDTPGKEID
ncbi:unnamed protein product [Lupinus luteus]|uniref:Uncharacterized protein n=1 Tax=Lupinus luteus TaxID=3873 RepID=A0AAV1WA62_LUPLU